MTLVQQCNAVRAGKPEKLKAGLCQKCVGIKTEWDAPMFFLWSAAAGLSAADRLVFTEVYAMYTPLDTQYEDMNLLENEMAV